MNQYIITEEQFRAYEIGTNFERMEIAAKVRSHPYQSEREKVLDEVIHEISTAAPEMEGKKLFITVLALCRRIDKLRQAGD